MTHRVPSLHARRLALALVVAVGVAAPHPLPAQNADSVKASHEPLFTRSDAYYAAGFIIAAAAMAPIDLAVAHELRDSTTQANEFFQHSATGFRLLGNPGAISITTGMYVVGRLADRPRLADVGLHSAEAILFAEGVTDVLKVAVGRARPFQDPEHPFDVKPGRGWRRSYYASFPSGHTTAAFATAAALSGELGRLYPHMDWWVRPVLYGGAGLVGLSRMYNNYHWTSDVVVGAAIGTFSGWKIVRYNHTHPNNRLDRLFLGTRVAPTASGGTSVSFSWSF
ncbi:MAG TPA: phosphatase PAP2 family protein [Longimicrobiaceae bacterium]|nr:phosphatase PAP2 family protein [Longimicrobiaceae bacterium]